VPQARGAAPWPPLGAVPFNSNRRYFWWPLDDHGPPHPVASWWPSWSSELVSRPARGGVQTSRTRTLLLLLRAGHVAAVLRGHCSRLRTALLLFPALAGPREGERPKLRTSKAITIVLFVLAVSV
jgi:hypothetical protein